MKICMSAVLVLSLFLLFIPPAVMAADQAPVLPESLAARKQMAANMKTHTVFIKAEKPEQAVEMLNASNEDYAKRGWNVFSITPYLEDGDSRGFFVTYQKNLIVE